MKHTIMTRGREWQWDDSVTDNSKQRALLELHSLIGNMHSWSTYEGKDPEEKWNTHVSDLQNKVIDWLIELEDNAEMRG